MPIVSAPPLLDVPLSVSLPVEVADPVSVCEDVPLLEVESPVVVPLSDEDPTALVPLSVPPDEDNPPVVLVPSTPSPDDPLEVAEIDAPVVAAPVLLSEPSVPPTDVVSDGHPNKNTEPMTTPSPSLPMHAASHVGSAGQPQTTR